jgi:predicted CopG family antitoxin
MKTKYKTIRVTEHTHFKLAKMATYGKSMNDIIVDLIEFYEDIQNAIHEEE